MKKFVLAVLVTSLSLAACDARPSEVLCTHTSGTVYKGYAYPSGLLLVDEVGSHFEVEELTRNEYKCEIK